MKIKEICEKTSLTDRTVRYYIEEGLITPFYSENYIGRKSFDFSEEDLIALKRIATLRSFGFSVEEIKLLSKDREHSREIIEAVRERAKQSLDENGKRYNALSRIDLSRDADISEITERLSDQSVFNEEGHPNASIKSTVQGFLYASFIILSVWLPIAIPFTVLLAELLTTDSPIVGVDNLFFTLLCLLPSLALLLITKVINRPGRAVRGALTLLCCICIPLSVLFSSGILRECEHDYEPYRTVTASSCSNEGEVIVKCSTCGYTATEATEALPHSPLPLEAVEPTCGKDGLTGGSYCSECLEIISNQRIIPKTGLHTPITDPARAADCERGGLSEGSHCLDCGEVLVRQVSSPPLGHSYTAQKVAPSCAAKGYTLHQCFCGAAYVDSYIRETVYHDFTEYSSDPEKSICRTCGLKVILHGNAGGNDSVKYYLTGDDYHSYGKTLVVYGEGAMDAYEIDDPPWSYFAAQIKTVIIEEDITSVGKNAFSDKAYSNVGRLVIRSRHLKNVKIEDSFSGISSILAEIVFDYE